MTEPVVCILVDAFRHDYLERTHFLRDLGASTGIAKLRPILGYSDSIRATIFTGLYPDEHQYWMEYCFRPETSPFGKLARLAPLDAFPSDLAKRAAKFALSSTVLPFLARSRGYATLGLRHIPFRGLPCFDWTLRSPMTARGVLGAPSIFDRITEAGLTWSYLDASKLGRNGLLSAISQLPDSSDFVFIYVHYLDLAAHVFGVAGSRFRSSLERTDALVAQIFDRLQARLGSFRALVFSDHGMSPVRATFALPDLWTHPAFPERFCFALDATMVRLWWRDGDEKLRARLRARISDQLPGQFLDASEQSALHLRFPHRLYGDEIFLLEPGAVIFPNFHSYLRPKAMHAYHPDDPEQQGVVIGGDRAGGELHDPVELVEIGPLSLRMCGLPSPAVRTP